MIQPSAEAVHHKPVFQSVHTLNMEHKGKKWFWIFQAGRHRRWWRNLIRIAIALKMYRLQNYPVG